MSPSLSATAQPDVLREAVAAAVRAPSVHNTQPWRFRIGSDAVDIHADDARILPVLDPSGRQRRIICGAACEFLRVALRARGWDAEPTLLSGTRPDSAVGTALVRVAVR